MSDCKAQTSLRSRAFIKNETFIHDKIANLVPVDGGKRYRNKNTGKIVSKRDYQKRSTYERTELKLSNEEAARRRAKPATTIEEVARTGKLVWSDGPLPMPSTIRRLPGYTNQEKTVPRRHHECEME